MKTKMLTIGVVGIVTIPMKPDASKFTDAELLKQYEVSVLASIQESLQNKGIIFEGEADAVSNDSLEINLITPEPQINLENINDRVTEQIVKINDATTGKRVSSRKGMKYAKKGPKMHWKTREKMERLAKQDKRKKKK